MTHAQIIWAAAALVLIAGETLSPGVFLMWAGFAAGGVFLLLLAAPELSFVWQAVTFCVFAAVSIAIYLKFFRGRGAASDQPLLNRKSEQLVGQVFVLEQAIVDGRGRLKIGDAFWVAEGPDLPQGVRVRVTAARNMSLQVQPAD
jgi:membrane protein implicated in regulation of membrane protease activity